MSYQDITSLSSAGNATSETTPFFGEIPPTYKKKFEWGAYKSGLTPKEKCLPCGSAPTFWSINWAAALLHLVNTVATIILWINSDDRDHVFKLKETYSPWVPRNGQCLPGAFQISEDWCVDSKTEETSELSLWWLVIVFHFLSFLFQALAMAEWNFNFFGFDFIRENYVNEVVEHGTNSLRMIEYSISATLMQISIALILGVWERLAIIGIAFLTAVTMLLGLIAEQLKNDRKNIAWISHFTGWLSMLGVWVILGRQFYLNVEKSGSNPPPGFVYAIVIVIAILYIGFGFIQFAQLYLSTSKNSPTLNRTIEIVYCVNSLTSKTFLGWILFGNALSGMATNN